MTAIEDAKIIMRAYHHDCLAIRQENVALREALRELLDATDRPPLPSTLAKAYDKGRAALAKVAQPQPATKGE